jgi:hypothetical protein
MPQVGTSTTQTTQSRVRNNSKISDKEVFHVCVNKTIYAIADLGKWVFDEGKDKWPHDNSQIDLDGLDAIYLKYVDYKKKLQKKTNQTQEPIKYDPKHFTTIRNNQYPPPQQRILPAWFYPDHRASGAFDNLAVTLDGGKQVQTKQTQTSNAQIRQTFNYNTEDQLDDWEIFTVCPDTTIYSIKELGEQVFGENGKDTWEHNGKKISKLDLERIYRAYEEYKKSIGDTTPIPKNVSKVVSNASSSSSSSSSTQSSGLWSAWPSWFSPQETRAINEYEAQHFVYSGGAKKTRKYKKKGGGKEFPVSNKELQNAYRNIHKEVVSRQVIAKEDLETVQELNDKTKESWPIKQRIENSKTTPAGGAKSTKLYKGRKYVVRTGSRGGKYILVKGTKVYL